MADQLCTHKIQLLRCDNDALSSLYQNQWNICWVFNFFGLSIGENRLKCAQTSSNVRYLYLKMIREHEQIFTEVTVEFTGGRPRVAASFHSYSNCSSVTWG